MKIYTLPVKQVLLSDFIEISGAESGLALSKSAEKAIVAGAKAVENIIKDKKVVYGVNTGIGDLCDCVLEDEISLKNLQENIILSHACGCAPYLDEQVARGVFFLVINSRAKGYSGLHLETIKK